MEIYCHICGKHVKECGRLFHVSYFGQRIMVCKECRKNIKKEPLIKG